MSAPAILQTRQGKYCLVQAELPGQGLVNIGVLLEDPENDTLHLRFRRDLATLAEDQDLDVLEALAEDLAAKASEMGAEKLLEYLESTLSGSIRITDREEVLVDNFTRALDRLYRKNVPSQVQEFRTHLPLYSLRAAAGKFLDNAEASSEGWIEAPQDLHLKSNMFVARIEGRSMEPRIPDGSWCVFRHGVVGSREGMLVLVENRDTANDQYTVKRYSSEKEFSGDEWRHKRIHLQALNPEHPSWSWDLEHEPDKFRVLAEFVCVLD
jgi:SOS-response transcriptional repressor LexA